MTVWCSEREGRRRSDGRRRYAGVSIEGDWAESRPLSSGGRGASLSTTIVYRRDLVHVRARVRGGTSREVSARAQAVRVPRRLEIYLSPGLAPLLGKPALWEATLVLRRRA